MGQFALLGVCLAALIPLALLRKSAAEQGLMLTLAVVALVSFRCIALLAPVVEELEEMFRRSGLESSYIAVLLRAVTLSVVTRLSADLCRDGGSQSMATAAELAGAVGALVIALPLLEAVLQLIGGYLG